MPTSPILKRAPFRHNSPVQPAAMTSSSVFASLRSTPTRLYPNVSDTSLTIWSRSVSGSSVELIFCATRCSRYRSSMYEPADVLLALTAGSRFRRRVLHAAPERVRPAADALGWLTLASPPSRARGFDQTADDRLPRVTAFSAART